MTRPLLTTARLRLEPLTDVHADLVAAVGADPEVMRFLTGHERPRDEVVEQWLPHMTDPALDVLGLGFWFGFAEPEAGPDAGAGGTAEWEPVGWWCLTPRDDEPDTGWLGYRLLGAARGHGYATEGAAALLTHGFDTLGLDRVRAETMAVNTPSRAVLERLGMHVVQTYVGQWEDPLPGWEQGEVVYLLNRGDWLTR